MNALLRSEVMIPINVKGCKIVLGRVMICYDTTISKSGEAPILSTSTYNPMQSSGNIYHNKQKCRYGE